MARAYSLDLRERVVAAVVRGLSCRAVAVRFDVSVASVVKWAQRARATGSPAARPMGGKRRYLLAGQRSWPLARLDEKPDLTLHTLVRELGAHGVTVSCDTLWRFLRREGFSFKKSVAACEQERPDVARRRAHTAAMAVLARLGGGHESELRVAALGSAAARLLRAYATQVEVLRRLRHGGQQYVRVEHVYVNDGGQAVIGNVKQREMRG
jgi:transposase